MLRAHSSSSVHLVIPGSVEHIVHCLPDNMGRSQQLKAVVGYITKTSYEVGVLCPHDPGAAAAAEEVAAFVKLGGLEDHWALPAIRAIDNIEWLKFHEDIRPSTQSTTRTSSAAGMRFMEDAIATSMSGPAKTDLLSRAHLHSELTTSSRHQLLPVSDLNSTSEQVLKFPLLKLPEELQNEIYKHLLLQDGDIDLHIKAEARSNGSVVPILVSR